jgi:ATP-dependent DNA helicase RecG
MVLTQADFETAFPTESGLVEFKQGLSEEKVREAVAAFSNTSGGVVLLGVGPDRSMHDRPLTGEWAARLHRVVGDIRNPGRYDLHEVTVGDRSLTVIAVDRRREGFAQLRDGRVLVRRGASNVPLFDMELTRFVSARALTRFESTTTDVGLAAADPALVRAVTEAHRWSEGAVVTERFEDIGFCRLEDGSLRLTVAGALYLLAAPEQVLGKAFIEIFRYREPGSPYDKRLHVTGALPIQVEGATRALLEELGSDVIVVGLHRHEMPRIPEPVLREALANAVAHRVYESARQPVRVEVHPDRVTIRSPGALPEPVTIANIREQNAARNIDVIKALRRFRLAEDAGMGVDLMQDTMEAELLERPEFETDGTSVTVTLRLGSAVTPRERAWVSEVEARGQIRASDRILLIHAARGELLTNTVVRQLLGADSTHARAALQRLRDAGFLQQSGQRGGSSYLLADGLSAPVARLDDEAVRTTIRALAAEGAVSNEMVRERTGLDRLQVLAVLNDMVQSGELLRHGERRGTRYLRA